MRLVFQPLCTSRTLSRLHPSSNYGFTSPCLPGRRHTHTTANGARKSIRLTLIGPPVCISNVTDPLGHQYIIYNTNNMKKNGSGQGRERHVMYDHR